MILAKSILFGEKRNKKIPLYYFQHYQKTFKKTDTHTKKMWNTVEIVVRLTYIFFHNFHKLSHARSQPFCYFCMKGDLIVRGLSFMQRPRR